MANKRKYNYGGSGQFKMGREMFQQGLDKIVPPTNPLSIGMKLFNFGMDAWDFKKRNENVQRQKDSIVPNSELLKQLQDPNTNKGSLNMTEQISGLQSGLDHAKSLQKGNFGTDVLLPNIGDLGSAALGIAGKSGIGDLLKTGQTGSTPTPGSTSTSGLPIDLVHSAGFQGPATQGGLYKYGGGAQENMYEAEGGEVIQHEPGNQPGTSGNMQVLGNNPTLSKLEGKSHERGGENVDAEGDQYVFSKTLKSDEWDMSFAKAAEKIAKKLETFSDASSEGDQITKDTADAMHREWSRRLSELKGEQEKKRKDKFMELLSSGAPLEELHEQFPDITEQFMKENAGPQQQEQAGPVANQDMGRAEMMLPPEMRWGGKMKKYHTGGDVPEHPHPHEGSDWLGVSDEGVSGTQPFMGDFSFEGSDNPLKIYSQDEGLTNFLGSQQGSGDNMSDMWFENLPPNLKTASSELGIKGLGSFADDVNLITAFETKANELGYPMGIEPEGQGKVGEEVLSVSNWGSDYPNPPEPTDYLGDLPDVDPPFVGDDSPLVDIPADPEEDEPIELYKPPSDPLFGPFTPAGEPNPITLINKDKRQKFKEKIKSKFKTKTKIDNTNNKDFTSGVRTENFMDLMNFNMSPWYNLMKSQEEITHTPLRLNPFYHQLTTQGPRQLNIQPQLNRNLDMLNTNMNLSKDFTGGNASELMQGFNLADQNRQQGDSAAWQTKYAYDQGQIDSTNEMKRVMGDQYANAQASRDEIVGQKMGKQQEFEKSFFEQMDASGQMAKQMKNMKERDKLLAGMYKEVFGIDIGSMAGGDDLFDQIDLNDPTQLEMINAYLVQQGYSALSKPE